MSGSLERRQADDPRRDHGGATTRKGRWTSRTTPLVVVRQLRRRPRAHQIADLGATSKTTAWHDQHVHQSTAQAVETLHWSRSNAHDQPDLHVRADGGTGGRPVRLHQRRQPALRHKAEDAKRDLGAYDWRISSADKLKAYEDRRDLFTRRWIEFYQVMKGSPGRGCGMSKAMNWKVEVVADDSGKWYSNGMLFGLRVGGAGLRHRSCGPLDFGARLSRRRGAGAGLQRGQRKEIASWSYFICRHAQGLFTSEWYAAAVADLPDAEVPGGLAAPSDKHAQGQRMMLNSHRGAEKKPGQPFTSQRAALHITERG